MYQNNRAKCVLYSNCVLILSEDVLHSEDETFSLLSKTCPHAV